MRVFTTSAGVLTIAATRPEQKLDQNRPEGVRHKQNERESIHSMTVAMR